MKGSSRIKWKTGKVVWGSLIYWENRGGGEFVWKHLKREISGYESYKLNCIFSRAARICLNFLIGIYLGITCSYTLGFWHWKSKSKRRSVGPFSSGNPASAVVRISRRYTETKKDLKSRLQWCGWQLTSVKCSEYSSFFDFQWKYKMIKWYDP